MIPFRAGHGDSSADRADVRFDVAVVGLGPAGRSLAHHCAALGLSVLAVDPAPEAVWTPTYGMWEDEVAHLLPRSAFRSRTPGPVIAAPEPHRLDRTYVVLDNAAVQTHLHLRAVEVRHEALADAEVSELRRESRVVVDARGAHPTGRSKERPAGLQGRSRDARSPLLDQRWVSRIGSFFPRGQAWQTAYGIVVPATDAEQALRGAPALLMDWSLDWAEKRETAADRRRSRRFARGGVVPSFLYAIPLGDGTVLVEETTLAASPPLPVEELRERLRCRLIRRGVEPRVVDDPIEVERVHIPMRGRNARPPHGAVAIGTAGRGGNLVTGYSVAHSLQRAPMLAHHIAAGLPLPPDAGPAADLFREAGLRALLRLDTPGLLALFDAFGRSPASAQRAFLDRSSGAGPLLTSMTHMWVRMTPRNMRELVRATVSPL